jgi:hypothetical protein
VRGRRENPGVLEVAAGEPLGSRYSDADLRAPASAEDELDTDVGWHPMAGVVPERSVQGRQPPPSGCRGRGIRRPAGTALLAAALAVGAAACGGGSVSADQLAQLQQLATQCPTDGSTPAVYLPDDVSGSSEASDIEAARHGAIKAVVTQTAVCGGHLRVVAFTASAAASTTVFDGDLKPAGATPIAQLRKVPALVDQTMPGIETGLREAAVKLQPGSDIVAQFRLAKEYQQQLAADGKPHRLAISILTDGEQSVGVDLTQPSLTAPVASALANQLPPVTFPAGTTVTIAGIGKVSGQQPATAYVDALKAFYSAYCGRTGAACIVATDYSPGS